MLSEGAAHQAVARPTGLFAAGRFNAAWLRETVVDANDGIIATAGLIEGFAGAGAGDLTILVAGLSAMTAGGMAAGATKYAEASSERDAQDALVEEQARELALSPEQELQELVDHYLGKGLSPALAREVAEELTARDALAAHAEVKHGISLDEPRIIPILSALTTAIAFALGGSVPLLSAFFAPDEWRVVVTFVAVTLSLCVTSIVEAYGSRLRATRVVTRTVGVGVFVMVVTFLGGSLFEIRSE